MYFLNPKIGCWCYKMWNSLRRKSKITFQPVHSHAVAKFSKPENECRHAKYFQRIHIVVYVRVHAHFTLNKSHDIFCKSSALLADCVFVHEKSAD